LYSLNEHTKLIGIIKKRKKLAIENEILTGKNVTTPAELKQLWHLMPPQPEAAELTVACARNDYSASIIARAVEDCNAHLINMNVTADTLTDGRLTVDLRVNRRNVAGVARSLARYGYEVISTSADNDFNSNADSDADNTLQRRAAELLHILEL
jgi:hypothetical protein